MISGRQMIVMWVDWNGKWLHDRMKVASNAKIRRLIALSLWILSQIDFLSLSLSSTHLLNSASHSIDI